MNHQIIKSNTFLSATPLNPLTGEVNNTDHLVTMQCGKLWLIVQSGLFWSDWVRSSSVHTSLDCGLVWISLVCSGLVWFDPLMSCISTGSEYNIPVCIWLHETHPVSRPRCYVCPSVSMMISPSCPCVDASGNISLDGLKNWTHVRHTEHAQLDWGN